MISPEIIVILGSALWLGAAFATGLPRKRIPSEFPWLFACIAFIGSLIGVTEILPEQLDVLVTLVAVTLYGIVPVVFTVYLFLTYSESRDGDGGGAKRWA